MKSTSSPCRLSIPFRAVLLFSLVVAVFTPATAKEPSDNQQAGAHHLFIVIANGIRYNDAFGNKHHLYTDNIWTKLRRLGTVCTEFYNTGLTYPLPAQASLLTGAWQVWHNPLSDTIRPSLPTIFEYWNKKNGGNSSYFSTGIKQYHILSHSEYREYGKAFAPVFGIDSASGVDTGTVKNAMDAMGNPVYKAAVSYIFERHPSLVCLNLDADGSDEKAPSHALVCRVDGCEEEDAGQINTYYESIILIDAIVADFWNRIQNDDIYKDKSLFIFLSTHGRHTDDFQGYGCNCRGCQQLNFLIIGPGVKKNFLSRKKRTLVDISSTLEVLFGIPMPFSQGKVMKEILE